MLRIAILLAAIPSAAFGDTINLSGTAVTLQPSHHQGAIGEVVMQNNPNNGPWDNSDNTLESGTLVVPFEFAWNSRGNADSITLSPPEGVMCVPASCMLELNENDSGTILLFDQQWMGF